MGFKLWWAAISKPVGPEIVVKEIEKRADQSVSAVFGGLSPRFGDPRDHKIERLEYRMSRLSDRFKVLLQERKTVDAITFDEQIANFAASARAVSNIESSGLGKSDAGRVVYARYHEEWAKLRMLAFHPMDLTEADAEIIFDEMVGESIVANTEGGGDDASE